MNRSETLQTWGVVVGLIIFTAIASAGFLWFTNREEAESETPAASIEKETEPITISIGDYVLGDELLGIPFVSNNIEGIKINPWLAALGAFVLVAALVGGTGLLFTVLSIFSSRQVAKVYADEGFQSSVATLNQRDSESGKELRDAKPVASPPEPERRLRWSLITTALLIIIMVWAAGLVYGVAFLGDATWEIVGIQFSATALVNLVLVLVTIAIIVVFVRSHEPEELTSSKTDNNPVNWSYIWIILSGALILGIGAGLAIAATTISAG